MRARDITGCYLRNSPGQNMPEGARYIDVLDLKKQYKKITVFTETSWKGKFPAIKQDGTCILIIEDIHHRVIFATSWTHPRKPWHTTTRN